LSNEDECGDVRAFGKRKRENDINKTVSLNKKGKIREAIHENEKVDEMMQNSYNSKCYDNVMYIPFAELSEELDIFKKVSGMEITLTMGQLFKWSPKARPEIMKAFTDKLNTEKVCGYIPNIKVDMEGVVVNQGFYVIETASFDILLGTKYWYTISSPTRSASFIVSTVPKSWIGEVQNDYENKIDSDDESKYDEVDDIMAVRRIEVDELEEINKYNSHENSRLQRFMNNAKNKSNVRIHEIKLVKYEELDGLSFCGRVSYWDINDEMNDSTIKGKEIPVVSRLTKDNSALINLGPKARDEPTRTMIIDQLIKRVPEVFAYELRDIGKTNLVEYKVRTGDAIVPSMRLRLIRINNPETRNLFENYLKEMIECGLLEKGSGDYPLPIIRDILEEATGHNWYTSVDAFKGYWQIVMCMGLKNASETFQRLMDCLLEGERWKNIAAAYQDDVGIWMNR
ncbi:5194_t:CDS:2, partial [Ambispora leptoticha]